METRCELAEAAAFADMWDALGLPVLRIAGATCIALPSEPEYTPLNRAIALGLAEPAGRDVLDEIEGFFRGTAIRRWAVAVAPGADPALEAQLGKRGFTAGYAWMRFRRWVEPPPPFETDLQVVDTEDGRAFGAIMAAGLGLAPEVSAGFDALAGRPGWHLFLALAGDEPVGTAALFARDGIGWFGGAATLPEHRGRGAQTALLAARIHKAAALSLEALTVETGENVPDRPNQSYRNILRAGFAEWYLRPNLLSPV